MHMIRVETYQFGLPLNLGLNPQKLTPQVYC